MASALRCRNLGFTWPETNGKKRSKSPSIQVKDRRATEILDEAASELLADGRIETLERWLEECGEAAGEHPGALLVRAELLTRQGELGQAATLAESVAINLPQEHRLASRANHIAGQALYLRSRSDLAAPLYAKALEDGSH